MSTISGRKSPFLYSYHNYHNNIEVRNKSHIIPIWNKGSKPSWPGRVLPAVQRNKFEKEISKHIVTRYISRDREIPTAVTWLPLRCLCFFTSYLWDIYVLPRYRKKLLFVAIGNCHPWNKTAGNGRFRGFVMWWRTALSIPRSDSNVTPEDIMTLRGYQA